MTRYEIIGELARVTAGVASGTGRVEVACALRALADVLAPADGQVATSPRPEAPAGRLVAPSGSAALAVSPAAVTGVQVVMGLDKSLEAEVDAAVGVQDAAALGEKTLKRHEVMTMVATSLVRYWIVRSGRNPATTKASSGRVSKVRARLEAGYSVADIKQAIANAADDEFYSGNNDRRTRYDTIELICRSDEKLEQLRDLASAPVNDSEMALEVDPVQRAKMDDAVATLEAKLRRTRDQMQKAMKANDHATYHKLEAQESELVQQIRALRG